MNKLFIICGLSFAGKSTLAEAMVESLGHEEVDVDNTKIALYGSDVQDDALTREEWDRIYEETDRQIIDLLNSGKNLIDASRNFTRTERDHIRSIADNLGCQTVTIHVATSEAIARQRWQENRRTRSRRDVTDHDFEDIVRVMEPPMADEQPLLFHSGDDIANWITANIQVLK
jgi:predicted kinase